MNSQELGRLGEELTAREYERRGYKIIGRNVRLESSYRRLGEIDVIARRKKQIVFVEVKSRSSSQFMQPAESVGSRKSRKLLRAVKAYLAAHRDLQDCFCRIDVSIIEPALDGRSIQVYIIEDAIQDNR